MSENTSSGSNNSIKNRLEELKSQTLRLKQLVKNTTNYEEITQLLAEGSQLQQFATTGNAQDSQTHSQHNQTSSFPALITNNTTPKKKKIQDQKIAGNSPTKSTESAFHVSVQKELLSLRQENMRLEKALKKQKVEADDSRRELNSLVHENKQLREKLEYSRVYEPYLEFGQEIECSISRLPVLEDNLADLVFSLCRLDITKGRIQVSAGRDTKQFYLVDLSNVRYFDPDRFGYSRLMVLSFTRNSIKQYVVLRYQSVEQQKRWDVSLYINRMIEVALKKTSDQFAEQFEAKKKQPYYRQSAIREEDQESENEYQQQAMQANEVDRMLRNSEVESSERKKTAEFASIINKMNIPPDFQKHISLGQEPKSFSEASTQTQFEIILRSEIIKSQQREQEKKEQQLREIQNAKATLAHGFKLNKCGTWPISPKAKKIYLRREDMCLIWEDFEESKKKKIGTLPISKIYKVEYGVIGEQLANYDKTLDKNRCVVIRGEERNIELYGADANEVKKFASCLLTVWGLEKQKQMRESVW